MAGARAPARAIICGVRGSCYSLYDARSSAQRGAWEDKGKEVGGLEKRCLHGSAMAGANASASSWL